MDVNYLKGIEFSENPIPTFTKLKDEGVSGFLSVKNVGGGTANTEFEILTGMNLDHFGFGEYPYTTILKSRACESIAYNLKRLGYGTTRSTITPRPSTTAMSRMRTSASTALLRSR